jgi:MYXO-CTERM domain-containing protein
MKTRFSVTVAVLAVFAAAGCDDGSATTLGNGAPNRLPQRDGTDQTPPSDPDKTGTGAPSAGNTTIPTTPSGAAVPTTGATPTTGAAPGTPGAGTGGGNGMGTGPGGGLGAGSGNTAVLNTYSKVWVTGDDKGPAKIGKLTGAGTMDASFNWDQAAYAADKTKVALLTTYTRSDNQANGNNSYLQGGAAFATLTDKGVIPGKEVALPRLNGDRTWMRPIAGFLSGGRALLMAASEDNGVNNNPQPVAYVVNTTTGALLPIPNSTRDDINKPTNIIKTAEGDGINVNNPDNQRGPHTIAADPSKPDTYLVGMQYNNQAQEAYSITVAPDNTIKINWLVRYSNTAQHCRPQVVTQPNSTIAYVAAVEANNQPAEIGFRVSKIDTVTGKASASKIVVRSDPKNNKYVSEPVIGLIGPDKLGITYGLSSSVRQNNNGNGHAGGKKIDAAVLVSTADLSVIGTPSLGVGQYGRHGSSFITGYGPAQDPALAVISGSSTGTGGGFIQMYPLKTDGTLGVKDAAKVYQVSAFSDVANLQARGKRNPNNQARGFINGMGNIPNVGFTTDPAKAATNFMPEVKAFSFSTVTGYSTADAMAKGQKESVWLSLVPAAWADGLQTVPGKPTDTPGINADGTGPAPRSTAPGTNVSGDVVTSNGSGADVIPAGPDAETRTTDKTRAPAADSGGGCSTSPASSGGNFGLLGLAIAGVLVALRRKREGQ